MRFCLHQLINTLFYVVIVVGAGEQGRWGESQLTTDKRPLTHHYSGKCDSKFSKRLAHW